MGMSENEIALWAFIAFCNFCISYKFLEPLYHVRSLCIFWPLFLACKLAFPFITFLELFYYVNIKQVHRLYGISVNSSPTIFKLENDPRAVESFITYYFTFEILESPRYYSNVYSETQEHNKLNGDLSDWSIAPSWFRWCIKCYVKAQSFHTYNQVTE